MSDISTFTALTGALPALAKADPRTQPTPEPPTVQRAVAAPLNPTQSAVASSPAAGNVKERQDHGSPKAAREPASERQRLTETLNQLNQRLSDYDTNLEFAIDDQYQEMVVRIVDRQTQEVVQQIPSEKALAFAEFFKEMEKTAQQPPSNNGDSKASKRLQIEGWLVQTMA